MQVQERRGRRHALRSQAAPIGVAEWTTAITTALPADLTSTLPSIADLEAELSELDAELDAPESNQS